jgi:hypothetical protein
MKNFLNNRLGLVCTVVLLLMSSSAILAEDQEPQPSATDLKTFGQLPARFNGRVTTCEVVAKNYLRRFGSRDACYDQEVKKQPAVSGRKAHFVDLEKPADMVKDSGISYQPPAGWKPLPASPFLKSSFEITQGEASAKVSIASLPAKGKLLENVTRWGTQLELPFENASKALENAKPVTLDKRQGKLVELHNPTNKQRILAAIVTQGNQDWFFKMMGDEAIVEKQQKAFEDFLKTVKFIEKEQPMGAGTNPK